MKKSVIALIILALLAAFLFVFRGSIVPLFYSPREAPEESAEPDGPMSVENTEAPEVVATGLSVPWEIAFLPDGRLLVTERGGAVRLIAADGTSKAAGEIAVTARGEGGLLGVVLHPEFAKNGFLYFYYTYSHSGNIRNLVERFVLREDAVVRANEDEREYIVDGLPGSSNHNGGRIAFGHDGYLYIATGDAGDAKAAQDRESGAGKILRVRDDGSAPPDNPFASTGLYYASRVYSYGHRNPQGLAWDSAGRLWATEHGRSGALSGFDEVNLIEPGGNYGWPDIQGGETKTGMIPPVLHSGPDVTWAPAGMAIVGNRIFFAGLRGQSLYSATIEGTELGELRSHFRGVYGRLRAVTLGPDGYLYISTSNRDGRGKPAEGDDRIIKVHPSSL